MKDLKLNDVIKLSDSLYNSPGLFSKNQTQTAKRGRMVIDFDTLNEKTIGNSYPLPNITEILDQLENAKYLVYSISHHLGLAFTKYAQKTVFSTHRHFNRMPFKLLERATLQRPMDQVAGNRHVHCCLQQRYIVIYVL